MTKDFQKWAVLLQIAAALISAHASTIYCISPSQSTSANCNVGTSAYSFAPVLSTSDSTTDLVLLLTNVPGNYYFLLEEYQGNSAPLYNYTATPYTIFNVQSITIKPYFCSDYNADPATDNCFTDTTQTLTIFLKTDQFSIQVTNNINLTNINFDGSENIQVFNLPYTDNIATNQTQCITEAQTCCPAVFPDVSCSQTNIDPSATIVSPGLFELKYNYTSIMSPQPSVSISNCAFTSLNLAYSYSLLSLDVIDASISIDTITVSSSFFYQGLINIYNSSNADPICASGGLCLIMISTHNSNFQDFNPYQFSPAASSYSGTYYMLITSATSYQIEFLNNSLLTPGCLLLFDPVYPVTLTNGVFTNNFIYSQNLAYDDISLAYTTPSTSYLSQISYGLICIANLNAKSISPLNLLMSSTLFENNTGLLINQFTNTLVSLVFDQLTFTNNTCGDSALITCGSSNPDLNITNSVFDSNNGWFGVLYLGFNDNYNSYNNTFMNNAGYHACLMYIDYQATATESTLNCTNNTVGIVDNYFYGNLQTPQSTIIYVAFSTYSCDSCLFNENTAVAGILTGVSSTITITNSNFTSNTYPTNASTVGGIVSISLQNGITNFTNCIFAANFGYGGFATEGTGVLVPIFAVYQSWLWIQGSTIQDNIFDNACGILYVETGYLNLLNSLVTNNSLVPNYSVTMAMITTASGQIFFNSTTFTLSSNTFFGVNTNLYVEECNFTQNIYGYADEYSGGRSLIYSLYGIVYINDTFFDDTNYVFPFSSNTFMNIYQTDLYFQNVTMQNIFGLNGAAIKIIESDLTANYSTFQNMSFTESGSAINIITGAINFIITSSSFMGIIAPVSHISVTLTAENMNVTIQDCIFEAASTNSLVLISQAPSVIFTNNNITASPSIARMLQQSQTSMGDYAVRIDTFDSLLIDSCLFSNIASNYGALYMGVNNNNAVGLMSNNDFESNTAIAGAAVYIEYTSNNSNITFINVIFNNNSVQNIDQPSIASVEGKGGALYYSCQEGYNCSVLLQNCSFTNNFAAVGGGAIFWDYYPPFNTSDLIFQNNTASYGNDFGSSPVYVSLVQPTIFNSSANSSNSNSNNNTVIFVSPYQSCYDIPTAFSYLDGISLFSSLQVLSGVPLSLGSRLVLFDSYNQIVNYDSSSMIVLQPNTTMLQDPIYNPKNYSLEITPLQVTASSGTYDLSSITVSHYPGYDLEIFINITSLTILPPPFVSLLSSETIATLNSINQQVLNVKFDFADCSIGSYFTLREFDQSKYGICTPCINSSYLLDPNPVPTDTGPCIQCDYSIFVSCAQSYLYLQPGFWRMNSSADIFLSCPYSPACPGGMNTTNWTDYQCGANFSDNLCFTCPPKQAHFGSESACSICTTDFTYYLKFAAVLIGQGVIIVFTVKYTMGDSLSYDPTNEEKDSSVVRSNLIKIVSNYLEIMTLVSTVNINWPDSYKTILGADTIFSIFSNFYFSVDCFLVMSGNYLPINNYYVKLILIFLTPYLASLGSYLFWVIVFWHTGEPMKGNSEFENKIITTIVIIVYTLQPTLVQFALSLFQCQNLYRSDTPIYFLQSEYAIKCWDTSHEWWALGLGLTNFLLWGAVAPGIILYNLYKKRDQLDERGLRMRYAFLYSGYTKNRYYWEIFIMTRKMTVIVILIFAQNFNVGLQESLCFAVIVAALYINAKLQPFDFKVLNLLEEKALIMASILCLTGLIIYLTDGDNVWSIALLIAILAGQIYFAVSVLIAFYNALQKEIEDLKEKYTRLHNRVVAACGIYIPCCLKLKLASTDIVSKRSIKTFFRLSTIKNGVLYDKKFTRSIKTLSRADLKSNDEENSEKPSKLKSGSNSELFSPSGSASGSPPGSPLGFDSHKRTVFYLEPKESALSIKEEDDNEIVYQFEETPKEISKLNAKRQSEHDFLIYNYSDFVPKNPKPFSFEPPDDGNPETILDLSEMPKKNRVTVTRLKSTELVQVLSKNRQSLDESEEKIPSTKTELNPVSGPIETEGLEGKALTQNFFKAEKDYGSVSDRVERTSEQVESLESLEKNKLKRLLKSKSDRNMALGGKVK